MAEKLQPHRLFLFVRLLSIVKKIMQHEEDNKMSMICVSKIFPAVVSECADIQAGIRCARLAEKFQEWMISLESLEQVFSILPFNFC